MKQVDITDGKGKVIGHDDGKKLVLTDPETIEKIIKSPVQELNVDYFEDDEVTISDRLKSIPEGSSNQRFSEPELRFSIPKPKASLRREILTYILNFFKWVFYNLILIYAGQRVVNFLNDPYLEDSYNEPFTSDVFIVMLVQSLGFLVIGGLVVSGYKLLFKKKYTWQNIFTFVITLIIVLIGVFL